MADLGLATYSKVLRAEVVTAPPEVCTALALRASSRVVCIQRLRFVEGEPLIIETAWFPARIGRVLLQSDLSHAAIYDILAQHAHLVRAHETIRPIILTKAHARSLRVPVGSAAFLVERTTYGPHGPVEWRTSIIRGDRYLYSVDLPIPHPMEALP